MAILRHKVYKKNPVPPGGSTLIDLQIGESITNLTTGASDQELLDVVQYGSTVNTQSLLTVIADLIANDIAINNEKNAFSELISEGVLDIPNNYFELTQDPFDERNITIGPGKMKINISLDLANVYVISTDTDFTIADVVNTGWYRRDMVRFVFRDETNPNLVPYIEYFYGGEAKTIPPKYTVKDRYISSTFGYYPLYSILSVNIGGTMDVIAVDEIFEYAGFKSTIRITDQAAALIATGAAAGAFTIFEGLQIPMTDESGTILELAAGQNQEQYIENKASFSPGTVGDCDLQELDVQFRSDIAHGDILTFPFIIPGGSDEYMIYPDVELRRFEVALEESSPLPEEGVECHIYTAKYYVDINHNGVVGVTAATPGPSTTAITLSRSIALLTYQTEDGLTIESAVSHPITTDDFIFCMDGKGLYQIAKIQTITDNTHIIIDNLPILFDTTTKLYFYNNSTIRLLGYDLTTAFLNSLTAEEKADYLRQYHWPLSTGTAHSGVASLVWDDSASAAVQTDEEQTSYDISTVYVDKVPSAVTGIWLASDPSHTGTDYYSGGSYDPRTRKLTLGSALPNEHTDVIVTYTGYGLDVKTFFDAPPSATSRLFYTPPGFDGYVKTILQYKLRINYNQYYFARITTKDRNIPYVSYGIKCNIVVQNAATAVNELNGYFYEENYTNIGDYPLADDVFLLEDTYGDINAYASGRTPNKFKLIAKDLEDVCFAFPSTGTAYVDVLNGRIAFNILERPTFLNVTGYCNIVLRGNITTLQILHISGGLRRNLANVITTIESRLTALETWTEVTHDLARIDNDITKHYDDIYHIQLRLALAEAKLIEQQIEIAYIEGRTVNNSSMFIEQFINEDNVGDFETAYNTSARIFKDTEWNNNWQYNKDSNPQFKNGFMESRDASYVLEITEEFNMEGVGFAYKCAISQYDVINQCYWFISNGGAAYQGEITKISKYMKDGKINILARYILPAGAASTHWGGIDCLTNGSKLYFILTGGAVTTSKIYGIAINSDGSLGATGYKKYNGETVDLTNSVFASQTISNAGLDVGYYTDVVQWDDTNVAVLLMNGTTAVSLILRDQSTLAYTPGNAITGFEKYVGGSVNSVRSICKKDSDFYIRVNDVTDNLRHIFKFNTADIVSSVILKAIGRFPTSRDVDAVTGSGYSSTEGITISAEGDFLEITCTASYGVFMARRSLKDALWAENQICEEWLTTNGGTSDNRLLCFDGDYMWYSANNNNDNAVRLYRKDMTTGAETYATLNVGGWDYVYGMCIASVASIDYCYFTGYDGSNYVSRVLTKASVVAALGGNLSMSGGAGFSSYESAKVQYGITTDGTYLYISVQSDNAIDRWTLGTNPPTTNPPTKDTNDYITMQAAITNWHGLAYKNGMLYVTNYNSGGTSKIYVIDLLLRSPVSPTWYIIYIYQDAKNIIASAGCGTIATYGNNLYMMNNTQRRVSAIKTLEDNDVMQLQNVLRHKNVLISDYVSGSSEIVERRFRPEEYSDINDVPHSKYCVLGYYDEGISELHLDEYLNYQTITGKPRYDPRKIMVRHYKRGANNVFVATWQTLDIKVKDDIIVACTSVGSTPAVVTIDLKSGKARSYYTTTNSALYYNGPLSQRNDALGYTGTHNPNLLLSSDSVRRIKMHTFEKGDASSYNQQYPTTYVMIGTYGGCDLLIFDWDANNNRTPRVIWKNIGNDIYKGSYAFNISPDGKYLLSYDDTFNAASWTGYVYISTDYIWDISAHTWWSGTQRYYSAGDKLGSPVLCQDLRAWKTAYGTWHHQIGMGSREETSGGLGSGRLLIYDFENNTSEYIYDNNVGGGVNHGFIDFKFFKDKAFAAYYFSSTAYLFLFRKIKINDKIYASMYGVNGWTVFNPPEWSITTYNRPRFLSGQGTSNWPRLAYSEDLNILLYSLFASLNGLDVHHFLAKDNCVYESKDFEIDEFNPTAYRFTSHEILPYGD